MATRQEQIAEYIREHIKRAREERSMSQEELAKAIDKTNVTISDIERGKVGVSAVDLALIAKALNRPMSYFIPNYVRIRVPPDDLRTTENRLIADFRRLEYIELENLVLDFVSRLSDFSQKGELRRLANQVVDVTKMITGKD